MSKNRPSPIGLALAAIAALVFVGGTLWSVLSAEEAEIENEQPRSSLSEVMDESDLVVRGVSGSILRLGDPSDAGVRAEVQVEEVLTGKGAGSSSEIVIFDRDFRESWIMEQEMVLFLSREEGLPEGAEFRVRERCILEEEALPCPYDLSDLPTSP
jgi:hypothetical protein